LIEESEKAVAAIGKISIKFPTGIIIGNVY
jgi:hypothetical protein